MRMHGATGVDLAYVAAGILGGAISFGHHIWDHAAGVALVRAAGGVVTDLAGAEWTVTSQSALAAAPGVHERLLDIVKSVGAPEEFDVRDERRCRRPGDSRAWTSTPAGWSKGVNFADLRDAGDPVELARLYDAEGADELTFLDITASSRRRADHLRGGARGPPSRCSSR